MSQAPDLEMQILDHYLVDKLRVNTIARQLSVHHTVVQRVLAQASAHPLKPQSQLSKAGNYLPVIRQTLETFPTFLRLRRGTVCSKGARTGLWGARVATSSPTRPL